jgi:hypothetical protein
LFIGVDLNPWRFSSPGCRSIHDAASNRPLTFSIILATGDNRRCRLANLRPLTTRAPRVIANRRRSRSLTRDDDGGASMVLPIRLQLALEASDTRRGAQGTWPRSKTPTVHSSPTQAAMDRCISGGIGHAQRRRGAGLCHALGESLPRHHSSGPPAGRGAGSRHSAFHWELAFPEVFFSEDGRPRACGFDAVVRQSSGKCRARVIPRLHSRLGRVRVAGSGHRIVTSGSCRAWQLARPGGRFG